MPNHQYKTSIASDIIIIYKVSNKMCTALNSMSQLNQSINRTVRYFFRQIPVGLPSKMLVALCLNKVLCFIMPLIKIYTMYSILKRRQCVFLTQ